MRLRNRVIFAAGIIGVSLTAVIVPSAMAAQPLLPCQEGSLTNCQIPPHGQLGAKLSVTIEPTITPLPTLTATPLPTVTPAPAPSIVTDTLPVTH